MSHPLELTQWNRELKQRFPELPASTVFVLTVYSMGMVLAGACGLSAVALFLATTLGWRYLATRKRLSEFYKEASAKSGFNQGVKRQDFDVTTCFAPLLRWILSLWSGRCLPLAIDVTNLGDRFHVLCVSVVVRGVAIPVAWKVLLGGVKDPWNPHWQALLAHLKPAVPDDWFVIVLSDRGLESPELFKAIKDLDWHPLMRVKKGGKFRPTGWGRFYCMGDLTRTIGSRFAALGVAYTGSKLRCTLLARFDDGHAEPWLLLTDLPPEAANALWYAFRTWIEQGFKIIKGGGWDWSKTRMEDPQRVERLWLVMAVATLWVVAIGVEDEVQEAFAAEQKEVARRMTESQEQARQRQQREQQRLQKLKEAMQARKARKEKREALKREEREKHEQEKSKKKAKKRKEGGEMGKKAAALQGGKAEKATRQQSEVAAIKARVHRVSTRGLAELKACWDRGTNRLPRHLHPEPWPPPDHPVAPLTEEEFLSKLK